MQKIAQRVTIDVVEKKVYKRDPNLYGQDDSNILNLPSDITIEIFFEDQHSEVIKTIDLAVHQSTEGPE